VPQTHAERQSAYRQRQAGQIAALRSALADAQSMIADQAAEIASLKRERERLYAMLDQTPDAPQDSGPQAPDCPHPAHLVDGDRCTGCGQVVDIW